MKAIEQVARVSVFVTAWLACACGSAPPMRQTYADNARNDDPWLQGPPCAAQDAVVKTEDVVVGMGAPVGEGETVRVHYVASLPDGKPIHDSRDDGPPVEIIIGSTKTICGFGRALAGMRPGGQRRAHVPPALAFGASGRPPDVPPGTELVFTIDLYLPADSSGGQGGPPPRPAGGGRRR